MAIELVYETHSTTIDTETGIATGWLEGRLSEAGRAQAKALGRIARAYTDWLEGDCDKSRVLEVIRQELHRLDRARPPAGVL